MKRLLIVGFTALAVVSALAAADLPRSSDELDPTVRELDAVRDQLVALDIEEALAALATILGRPGLTEGARVAALDLRAQAHAVSDDLGAAEKDYRAILVLQAGYSPSPDVTSKKAMERFARVRATLVGTVHLNVDPTDASFSLDGRPIDPSDDGTFRALAGERRLSASRKGFDPMETTFRAVAGADTNLQLRMVPNARTLIVRTDVKGVAVTMDGVAHGVTARVSGDGSAILGPASLALDDVAIGEHAIGLTKSCFGSETIQEIVSVDLTDRSPRILPTVTMRPAYVRVTATGAQHDGTLLVDGERVAELPVHSFSMCPGARLLEVASAGRVVWSGTITAEEPDLTLDLAPRPNAVLVGSEWPKSWAESVKSWSVLARMAPPAGADLATLAGWSQVHLPPATDLAVASIPRTGVSGEARTVLFSPALKVVEERQAPPIPGPPSWVAATLGVVAVDGDPGSVVIARVVPDGPGAKAGLLPGDRLIAIDGDAVSSAAVARNAIARLQRQKAVVLEVASPAKAPRRIECTAVEEPRMRPPIGDDQSAVVRAAWAAVHAVAGLDPAMALSQLALALDGSGQDAAALDAWRRVRAKTEGVLAARADYAVGAALESGGNRIDAIAAFNKAQEEARLAGNALLSAAARDRLADLGVAGR